LTLVPVFWCLDVTAILTGFVIFNKWLRFLVWHVPNCLMMPLPLSSEQPFNR